MKVGVESGTTLRLQLVDANKALAQLRKSGQYAAILKHWGISNAAISG